jgi:hypothetical protein
MAYLSKLLRPKGHEFRNFWFETKELAATSKTAGRTLLVVGSEYNCFRKTNIYIY